ncbi:hypothetical protein [Nonomuraea jabiensis]|uniref:hypothetical protein n=1 Tax=Nonomuraea jabiensis TaxID=882448 RepID=UPI003D74C5E9
MAEIPEDAILVGLLTCGACLAGLEATMADGITFYVCTADGCGLTRVEAAELEQFAVKQLFEHLRSPNLAGEMVLATAELLDEFDTLETWWAAAEPSAKRELLAALIKHFIVMAPEHPAALMLQWRHNG